MYLLQEMCKHPFWNSNLPERPMPEEPMLASYIAAQRLAAAAITDGKPAAQAGRSSVDVMRLSLIVRSNLDKEAEKTDYKAASSAGADVQLHHPDAELDFEQQQQQQQPASGESGCLESCKWCQCSERTYVMR